MGAWVPINWTRIMGYYGFPSVPPDPPATKPATCTDILKMHETVVEEVLKTLKPVEKMIIYRQLNAEGLRTAGIDREIYREAQKELDESRS